VCEGFFSVPVAQEVQTSRAAGRDSFHRQGRQLQSPAQPVYPGNTPLNSRTYSSGVEQTIGTRVAQTVTSITEKLRDLS
jgi:hypothetical protein